jgi:hypothetical protein
MIHDKNRQPLTINYADYLLPTAPEVPRIEIIHFESPPPLNPIGVKRAGEGGTIRRRLASSRQSKTHWDRLECASAPGSRRWKDRSNALIKIMKSCQGAPSALIVTLSQCRFGQMQQGIVAVS